MASCEWIVLLTSFGADAAPPVVIEPRLVHLRNDEPREWSSFPAVAEATKLEVRFAAEKNSGEWTLKLRQQDLKQAWKVLLNGKPLGELVRDEADMVAYLPIAAGMVKDGENVLRIESPARGAANADDIRVGEIAILRRPKADTLTEATLEIAVVDADSQMPLPARITIADGKGVLQTTGTASDDHLAIRPGVIYTSDGRARFGVPAGKYIVYAGRGFEYSLAKSELTIAAGEQDQRTMAIHREVPTPGYAACDTHVHSLTFSGHGDASIDERMITLACEGIELPIATEHNRHIDYQPHAERLGVRRYFTPVVGNEVTTSAGHFNVFPVAPGSRVPDFKQDRWTVIFEEIFATPGVKVAILNHARDLHSDTRPFGSEMFNAAIGENLYGSPMRFNALEVINSGATQSDPLRLLHDWMALLNRGYRVTPVGSSDSHDVSRYIVGQGRTYIRCDDRDVANLNIESAVDNLLAGRVLVSYGLLVEMTVEGKYRCGDFAIITGDEVTVDLRVLGPHWTEASRILLYANGQLIREAAIAADSRRDLSRGVKWQATWVLPRPSHDVHLVAIALGPGVTSPYWPTAKPYQPTSPDWEPYVLAASGAIWLDADGDGRQSCARDYANRLFGGGDDAKRLIESLGAFDSATAAQAAHLLRTGGHSLDSPVITSALQAAPRPVQDGFRSYVEAWRENQRARTQR